MMGAPRDLKMNGLAEMVFISEIVNQAKIARRADERLQAAYERFDEDKGSGLVMTQYCKT